MKKNILLLGLVGVGLNLPLLTMTGCKYSGDFYEKSGAATTTTTSTTACTTAVASDSLTMVCIPANTAGFLMGSAAVGGTAIPEHTVASISAFAMAKYEVQYGDWLTVRTWATANGYTFANPGAQGNNGAQTNQHPVTTVSWRDAIIWCNAASEKQGLTPVYYTNAGLTTPMRDLVALGGATTALDVNAGQEDNPYVNWSANGYRLPTEAEWEYVARYIDGTTFMRGDAPSGWVDSSNIGTVDAAENSAVAWWNNAPAATSPVGTKAANALTIFDMSGNVWEWVWDWNGTYTAATPYTDADGKGPTTGTNRLVRGGGWNDAAAVLRGASRGIFNPWFTNVNIGFRPVRRP